MKLEDQVISVELAKRLEQLLGEEVKSSFYWIPEGVVHWHLAQQCNKGFVIIVDDEVYTESCMECYAAYTVAELMQMIPERFKVNGFGDTTLIIDKGQAMFGVHYLDARTETAPYAKEINKSFVQALADMLIYLLENKLTTPEEVNLRLNS